MDDRAQTFRYEAGTAPLLISIPHCGTKVPAEIEARLTDSAAELPDTDFFLQRLFGRFALNGAHVLWALHSRYVVDLNRPSDDAKLYSTPTTGLFPLVQFDGRPVYREGAEPTEAERSERLARYYEPYHSKVRKTLDAIQQQFGYAILFDAHSIRSKVPRLFDGVLPDMNIGTNEGRSASPQLVERLIGLCQDQDRYSYVVDGRFKGGYITRHYGRPEENVHAVQLEMAQSVYMREDGQFEYDEQLAESALPFLRDWVGALLGWRQPHKDR